MVELESNESSTAVNLLYMWLPWVATKGDISALKQEHSESTDVLAQGSSLPHIARTPDLGSQHGDLDHPQNVINCSLYHCREILKISKSAHDLLGNCVISDWTVTMVIQISTKI